MLIWPLVLWRWLREETGQATWTGRYAPPRRAHGVATILMGAVIVVTLGISVVIQQTWPADMAPQQLSEPAEPTE